MSREHAQTEYSVTPPPNLSLKQRKHLLHVVFGIIRFCAAGGDGPAVCVSMGLPVTPCMVYVHSYWCMLIGRASLMFVLECRLVEILL